jgi:hypothetical protein
MNSYDTRWNLSNGHIQQGLYWLGFSTFSYHRVAQKNHIITRRVVLASLGVEKCLAPSFVRK